MNMRLIAGLTVLSLFGATAPAATSSIVVDHTNTIPNTSAAAFMFDGQGSDWTAAVLKIDLTSGSVYNDPGFDGDTQQSALWGFVPALQWDSYVGIPGDGSGGIAGGAGDLGGGPLNIGGTGVDAVSVTWFNTNTTDTGPVQIANITVSDDAAGTWQLIVTFAGGQTQTGGILVNGWIPEPTSLALLGAGGLCLIRRPGS